MRLFDGGNYRHRHAALGPPYDIQPKFDFATPSDLSMWNDGGSFYLGAQGAQTVTPEPGTIALVGFSLVDIAFVRRRRRALQGPPPCFWWQRYLLQLLCSDGLAHAGPFRLSGSIGRVSDS